MRPQLTLRYCVRKQGLKTWHWSEVIDNEQTMHLPLHLEAHYVPHPGVPHCLGSGAGGVVVIGARGPRTFPPAPNSTSACVLHCVVLAMTELFRGVRCCRVGAGEGAPLRSEVCRSGGNQRAPRRGSNLQPSRCWRNPWHCGLAGLARLLCGAAVGPAPHPHGKPDALRKGHGQVPCTRRCVPGAGLVREQLG